MDCGSETVGTLPEDDTNIELVTQMLPECLVSVKLESSEDCCAKVCSATESQAQGVNNLHITTQLCNMSTLNGTVMQNLPQHCDSSGHGESSPCFHRHCASGVAELTQLPPWVSPCYSTHLIHGVSESTHPTLSCVSRDSSNCEIDRVLKSSGSRCENSAVQTVGGDSSDSNTFLNYVLNQQRSGGIFLLEAPRTTTQIAITDSEEATSIGSHTCAPRETESRISGPTNSTPSQNKDIQLVTTCNDTEASLSQEKNNKISIAVQRSSSEVLCSSMTITSDTHIECNTASKYSQTIPFVSLLQNSKTSMEDYDEDSHSSSNSQTGCPGHRTARKNGQCCDTDDGSNGANKTPSEASSNFCSKCISVSKSNIYQPCSFCGKDRTVSKYKANLRDTNKSESPNCKCIHHSCNCVCSNGTIHHLPESPTKEVCVVAHCINSVNEHSNTLEKVVTVSGKSCDSQHNKIGKRMQYLDVDRPFTCEVCFKNYPSSIALMNHTRYHRGDRPYQCETCNKAFATNSHLVTHRRVHTGERPFQCQLCCRSFADRSAFVKHERTHGPNGSIIKRFKCEECGNAFVDSCGLKKHIRIHTGERPYRCSVCEKTFSTSSTFVAHKRIHSGERPYKCDQCTKMFITKSHLLTHRRTHTGEKPFMCQVCNRSFADGSSFRRHERLHTGENRHMCDVCGKGFPYDTSLAKHKQSHIPGSSTYVYMM